MSAQRKFDRRQTRAGRRKFTRYVRTVERAQTMKAGLIAESERRRKRAEKDKARDARMPP